MNPISEEFAMMTFQDSADTTIEAPRAAAVVDMKFEAAVIPVSNVDRAATFYQSLGWRLDADIRTYDGRILQFTPPGSPASIVFGTGLTPASPGSARFLHLIVSDIEAARDAIAARGIAVSEVFHDAAGGYNRFDPAARASGPDPQRRTYASFAIFDDPDGNSWVLQEITTRFPGRIEGGTTSFASPTDLAGALRRASAAHGEHEQRTGQHDDGWPDWYAAYVVAEQAGDPLPA